MFSVTLVLLCCGCPLRASWKCLWVECLLFTHRDTPPSSSWIPPSWGFNLSNLITQPSWLGFRGLGYIIISFHRTVYIFWPTVLFLLFCTIVGQRWKDMTSSSCFFSLRACSGSLLSSLSHWFLSTALEYQCSQSEPFSSLLTPALLFTLWWSACWLVPTLRNNGALLGNLRVCFFNLCSCRPAQVPCGFQWAQMHRGCCCPSVHKPLDLGFTSWHGHFLTLDSGLSS